MLGSHSTKVAIRTVTRQCKFTESDPPCHASCFATPFDLFRSKTGALLLRFSLSVPPCYRLESATSRTTARSDVLLPGKPLVPRRLRRSPARLSGCCTRLFRTRLQKTRPGRMRAQPANLASCGHFSYSTSRGSWIPDSGTRHGCQRQNGIADLEFCFQQDALWLVLEPFDPLQQ